MLQITPKHMEGFERQRMESFALRMVERLRYVFGEEMLRHEVADPQLLPLVQRSMNAARSYGVEGELDLELFIDCLALLSPDFHCGDAHPWAVSTLQRTDIGGTAKMDLIHNHLVFDTVGGD